MTVGEFNAFIEGMNISKKDGPTGAQWRRIQEKIALLQSPFDIEYPASRGSLLEAK